MDILSCNFDTAQYFIFSDNVFAPLIYYSHFFAIISSLVIGSLIFFKNKKDLVSNILFSITIIFSLWVFFDLILWATEKPEFTMFFWSAIVLLELLVYALCVYFVSVFIKKEDISLLGKFTIFLPLLPIIILLPTQFILIGFDFTNCDRAAIQGPFATYYVYAVEIAYVVSILIFSLKKYFKADKEMRKQILLITSGVCLFLLSFSLGNIVESFTDNWTVGQIGLIGMPIFSGFLAYLIVKYKAFNTKLLGAQVLVVGLGLLVLVIAFIRNIENVKLVVAFTLLCVWLLGRVLIRSVQQEVKQREQLQILSEQLLIANDKLKDLDKLKTEFLSLASHQLRSPLTAIKGYASMVLDGDFGEINREAKDAIDRVFQSAQNLTKIVEDFLSVSKIESGGMKYEMAPFSIAEITNDMVKDLSITAEKRGLKMSFTCDDNKGYMVNGDKEKLRQVILNFIDNSIKYTKEGQIDVSVKRESNKILFRVKDTGMGMTKEIKDSLFQKFARGDGARMNTTGSGLGLYLAKEIVVAHKGTVFIESEGLNKGSTFGFELDAIK